MGCARRVATGNQARTASRRGLIPRSPCLAAAAKQRDSGAFDALCRRFEDDVLRYTYLLLGDWDEAADATQQAFVNVYINLPAFEDRGNTFAHWLFSIARNDAFARLKQRRREHPLDDLIELSAAASTPEDLAIAGDDLRELWRLLGQLPESEREVWALRLADRPDPEIGRMLGKSEGAVRTAASRGLRRLRDLMGVAAPPKGGRRG